MATIIRPEIRKSNKYWIDKHRYYELKHFCLQYPIWKRAYLEIEYLSSSTYDQERFKSNSVSDPTYRLAEQRVLYFNNMMKVEQSAIEADSELANYIIKAVTEGLSYTTVKSRLDIPCSRDTYYDRYRRFFWVLDKKRD